MGGTMGGPATHGVENAIAARAFTPLLCWTGRTTETVSRSDLVQSLIQSLVPTNFVQSLIESMVPINFVQSFIESIVPINFV